MNAKEFARRRKHLMELIGSSGIAILAAAPERVRSRDTLYVYRQDSDFYYLTGFREPEAVAVLVPGRAAGRVPAVLPRAQSRPRAVGRAAGRARGRGSGLRRRRRVSDLGLGRHPAGPARAQRPRLLLDQRQRVRSEAARLHPDLELEAPERPRAERARRARSPVARDAPLQEPRRDRQHAPGGARSPSAPTVGRCVPADPA